MTALEQQIKDALIKSSYDGMYESGNVTACAEVTKEQMKGFAEWISANYRLCDANSDNGFKYIYKAMSINDPNHYKTIDDLLDKYFEEIRLNTAS